MRKPRSLHTASGPSTPNRTAPGYAARGGGLRPAADESRSLPLAVRDVAAERL